MPLDRSLRGSGGARGRQDERPILCARPGPDLFLIGIVERLPAQHRAKKARIAGRPDDRADRFDEPFMERDLARGRARVDRGRDRPEAHDRESGDHPIDGVGAGDQHPIPGAHAGGAQPGGPGADASGKLPEPDPRGRIRDRRHRPSEDAGVSRTNRKLCLSRALAATLSTGHR